MLSLWAKVESYQASLGKFEVAPLEKYALVWQTTPSLYGYKFEQPTGFRNDRTGSEQKVPAIASQFRGRLSTESTAHRWVRLARYGEMSGKVGSLLLW